MAPSQMNFQCVLFFFVFAEMSGTAEPSYHQLRYTLHSKVRCDYSVQRRGNGGSRRNKRGCGRVKMETSAGSLVFDVFFFSPPLMWPVTNSSPHSLHELWVCAALLLSLNILINLSIYCHIILFMISNNFRSRLPRYQPHPRWGCVLRLGFQGWLYCVGESPC